MFGAGMMPDFRYILWYSSSKDDSEIENNERLIRSILSAGQYFRPLITALFLFFKKTEKFANKGLILVRVLHLLRIWACPGTKSKKVAWSANIAVFLPQLQSICNGSIAFLREPKSRPSAAPCVMPDGYHKRGQDSQANPSKVLRTGGWLRLPPTRSVISGATRLSTAWIHGG